MVALLQAASSLCCTGLSSVTTAFCHANHYSIIRSTLPSSLLSPKLHDVSADEGVFHEMTKRVLSSTRTTLLTVLSQTQMRMKHHARARILDISPRVRLSVAHVFGHSGNSGNEAAHCTAAFAADMNLFWRWDPIGPSVTNAVRQFETVDEIYGYLCQIRERVCRVQVGDR